MIDLDNYLLLDDFAFFYGIKKETILKKDNLPFSIYEFDNKFYIKKGNRSPYDKKHLNKIETKPDIYLKYSILKSTSLRRYIDNFMLKIEEEKFLFLIKILVEEGLLMKNDYGLNIGANAYDITIQGEIFINKYKNVKNDKFFKKLDSLFSEITTSVSKGITSALLEKVLK